jgi:hypothetical protein
MTRWITNINIGINHLAFDCQKNHIWAKVKDSKTRLKCYVIKDISNQVVKGVKLHYSRASDKTNMVELHMHFPHEWGISIVYPHYWLVENNDKSFNNHLNVVKTLFCIVKKMGFTKHVVIEMLCASILDMQKFMFNMMIKSNVITLNPPNTINPLTKMWQTIINFVILFHNISKYVKLVEIVII